jgi:VanZ family protein
VPITAFILLAAFLIAYRSYITKLRALALVLAIGIVALAQQITDYYFGHSFYDLQQNWHYLAYGIYAFVIYRDLAQRNIPLYRIILLTYFSAMLLSAFDEIIDVFISNRVFDICDIGKDVTGVYMGMVLTYFGGKYSQVLFKDWLNIRHRNLKGYYRHPFTLMILLLVLTFIFLSIGSILSDSQYWLLVITISVGLFAIFFGVLHLSQFKKAGYTMLAILVVLVGIQGFFIIKHFDDNIVYNEYGLTVYKGIPIPFFDIMIFPDDTFRLVDKKHFFNQRDREFMLKKKADIILIGSGADGKRGREFNDPDHEFIYNPYTKKATQVIIQKNSEAYKTFNRLKRENKNVLFVLHNTC